MYLEQIHEANDIKKLNERELTGLAEEIRTFLIEKISRTGGHLASNLGVVELTMAMHLSFQLPEDKMIWDVGHQSYTHKILTGSVSSCTDGEWISDESAKKCFGVLYPICRKM